MSKLFPAPWQPGRRPAVGASSAGALVALLVPHHRPCPFFGMLCLTIPSMLQPPAQKHLTVCGSHVMIKAQRGAHPSVHHFVEQDKRSSSPQPRRNEILFHYIMHDEREKQDNPRHSQSSRICSLQQEKALQKPELGVTGGTPGLHRPGSPRSEPRGWMPFEPRGAAPHICVRYC